jgi:hypothetical protein
MHRETTNGNTDAVIGNRPPRSGLGIIGECHEEARRLGEHREELEALAGAADQDTGRSAARV